MSPRWASRELSAPESELKIADGMDGLGMDSHRGLALKGRSLTAINLVAPNGH